MKYKVGDKIRITNIDYKPAVLHISLRDCAYSSQALNKTGIIIEILQPDIARYARYLALFPDPIKK